MPLIKQTSISEIQQKANLLEVVRDFIELNSQGKGDCPLCNGKKKFSVSNKKNCWKCWKDSCDFNKGGNGAISFLMAIKFTDQKEGYLDSVKYLADKYNVILEYEGPVERTKAPKNIAALDSIPHTSQRKAPKVEIKSFRDQQLEASGLTIEDQQFMMQSESTTSIQIDRYKIGTFNQYWEQVTGDDMILCYIGLDRRQMTFERDKGKTKVPYCRIRWQNPELHLDQRGKPMKYQSRGGSGVRLWYPNRLIEMYNNRVKIKRLYFVEGEKKADKMTKHGMIAVGMGGYNNFLIDGKFPHDIEMIVKYNQVEEVVFFVDSDWVNMGKVLPGNSVDYRPRQFMRAASKFKDHFHRFANSGLFLKSFFAYPLKNKHDEKGIDDLLVGSMAGKEIDVVRDLETASVEPDGKGKYTACCDVSTWSYSKFEQEFHLSDAKTFASYHKAELQQHACFKIAGYLWRFDEQGELQLAQPLGPDEEFWSEKTMRDGEVRIRIDNANLYRFIANHNYARMRMLGKENNYIFILNRDNIISEVLHGEIKDFVVSFVETAINNKNLLNRLYDTGKRYLGPDSFGNIPFVEPRFMKNGRDFQFLFFEKCYWKITHAGITEHDIAQLDGHIWKNQIVPHDVKYIGQPLFDIERNASGEYDFIGDPTEHQAQCDFSQFLWHTSEYFWRKKRKAFNDFVVKNNRQPTADEIEWFITAEEMREEKLGMMAKITAIGYLLHNFFDAKVRKAVIGMDAQQSEVGASNGRSGKSIIGEAIKHVVPTVQIAGKETRLTEDRFIFEEVEPGRTQVVYIDDVRMNFDFEALFPAITGGAKYETKGSRRSTISNEQMFKMYITTNHAIVGDGSSFQSRMIQLAFSDYYHDNGEHDRYQPINDFKNMFFSEWNHKQWNLFFNLMATCVMMYLKHGIIEAPKEALDQRNRRQEMKEFFLDWAETYFSVPFNLNRETSREDLYNAFLEKNPEQKRWVDSRSFKKKMKVYCKYKKYIFNPGRPNDKGELINGKPFGGDIKKGGVEYFIIADHNYHHSTLDL